MDVALPLDPRPDATVLIVDDDRYVREDLGLVLQDAGYATMAAADGGAALEAAGSAQLVLLDLHLELSALSGMDVLRRLAEERPEVPVIVVSGQGTVRKAVEATRLGIYDFLEKPIAEDRLLLTVRNALERADLRRQRDRLLTDVRERYRMVGSSPAMQRLYDLIDRAASVQSKVLITGETGTGKEMIAAAIHLNSRRAAQSFVPVNCAAIPEGLMESVLFGHRKGAFTGALHHHAGMIGAAEGGTLFLDEIGDMPLSLQAKLLRVLQENTYTRVGEANERRCDVRWMAATRRDLAEEVAAGRFRKDLYFRLNIITIHAPPLREHAEDVPALMDHFLRRSAKENFVSEKRLEAAAVRLLMAQAWPGNTRELHNIAERLVALFPQATTLTPAHVRQALGGVDAGAAPAVGTLGEARARFERALIRDALVAHDGSRTATADALGISRAHLWRLMKQYGLHP